MRFVSSLLLACSVALLSCTNSVDADLRMASQPKQQYKVKQRNAVQFVTPVAIYMEPSAFGYAGLAAQRNNAYDNFLRSNIDNEQDKRNFATEAGRDMLPFRTMEAALTDLNAAGSTKIGAINDGSIKTAVSTPNLVPLRWNNPHSSELEVNIWIGNNKYVVPVLKPTCSGEGKQDNVFQFTVPADFLQLPTKVPNFTGCNAIGDCVLQVYAHSVETRQYAIGTPIIITGTYSANTATDTTQIQPAQIEVGKDLSKLTNKICLSSADGAADIKTAVPYFARLISDQFNHAYQNSDYSPYSGQQPLAISQNLQAAAILSMTTGNKGELGRALLTNDQKNYIANLENKQKNIIKQYEGVTNKIIAAIGDNMKTGQTSTLTANQKLATAFRASEVGAVTTTRLTTNTYVPSFVIPAAQLTAAKAITAQAAKYQNLIDNTGTLQIYVSALKDMSADFKTALTKGFDYQPAALKPAATTLADATQFRKLKADGSRDNGQYAATQAYAAAKLRQNPPAAALSFDVTTDLSSYNADNLPAQPFGLSETQFDPAGMMTDNSCENDDIPESSLDLTTGQPLEGKCSTPSLLTFGNEASITDVAGSAYTNTINTLLLSLLSLTAAKFIQQ